MTLISDIIGQIDELQQEYFITAAKLRAQMCQEQQRKLELKQRRIICTLHILDAFIQPEYLYEGRAIEIMQSLPYPVKKH